jgi:hypothetical protein
LITLHITPKGQVTSLILIFAETAGYVMILPITFCNSTVPKKVAERDLKIKSFLAGYESIAPISVEEKRFLPVLGVSQN